MLLVYSVLPEYGCSVTSQPPVHGMVSSLPVIISSFQNHASKQIPFPLSCLYEGILLQKQQQKNLRQLLCLFHYSFKSVACYRGKPLRVLYSVTYYVFPSLTGEHNNCLNHQNIFDLCIMNIKKIFRTKLCPPHKPSCITSSLCFLTVDL